MCLAHTLAPKKHVQYKIFSLEFLLIQPSVGPTILQTSSSLRLGHFYPLTSCVQKRVLLFNSRSKWVTNLRAICGINTWLYHLKHKLTLPGCCWSQVSYKQTHMGTGDSQEHRMWLFDIGLCQSY
jgi:hypothetical protein